VARTYAPCGQTPELRAPLTREHRSVRGGVTAAGRLFTHRQAQACTGETVVDLLRHLLRQIPVRQIPGTLLVVGDGATIQRCQAVKDFLARGATRRLQLPRLPGYAPDLNPTAGVWNLLTRGQLKHRCCMDLDELRWELALAVRRLQRRRPRIRACFAQCGYVEQCPLRSVSG
jgi:hypothetical protein